ncbi:hypothetical protein [Pontibacter akesuensis]|uniref:SH3 domain-containing protein n=1 Tax=Pontibacter akesuensis TaxID=388950 RepID=A0A1I7K2G0_9BACT|nr:hypothetical protein [Pontibacter akesuensis]GHA75561.1 hypothetical protein GCM10007389_31810 [Pontibacter akesuensis]SFU91653.1 hypothetical protein SAMN04487941_3322 [Pontibacter akesuensis]
MKYHPFILALLLSGCLSACSSPDSSELQSATTTQPTAPQDSVAAGVAAVPGCTTESPLLLPSEATVKDASLNAYLTDLRQAVQTQNPEQLQQLLDPNIKTSFGGTGGWSSFTEQWHPENKDAEVWLLLDHLLRLGGGYPIVEDKNLYALPYVYSKWPDSIDAFSHVAVVKDGATLREQPAVSAEGICTLDRVVLQVDYENSYPQGEQAPKKEWWAAQTTDGKLQGYVHHTDVYSPVGYRALLNKGRNGKWRMTALVAGD